MNNQLILAKGSEDGGLQRPPELFSPVSNELTSDQNMVDVFVRHQEHRLAQLIQERHIMVTSKAVVWIDENGFLTAQGLRRMDPSEQQLPVPYFHQGVDADINATAYSPISRHPFRGLESLNGECQTLGSTLYKLIVKHLRRLPAISHSVWKKLLADLENPRGVNRHHHVEEMLKTAIYREAADLNSLYCFLTCCGDLTLFMMTDLDDIPPLLYRLGGVPADRSDREEALNEIDEGLADEISMFLHMANRMQKKTTSPKRFRWLASCAENLYQLFDVRQIGPSMTQLLTAVAQELEEDSE